jgi:hypothetical protein
MLNIEHDGKMIFWAESARTYALMLVTLICQVVFLWQVAVVNYQPDSIQYKCQDNNMVLLFVCVLTFEASAFGAFRDAIAFCYLLYRAPVKSFDKSKTVPLVKSESKSGGGAILDNEVKRNFLKRLFRSQKHKQWSLEAMTPAYKKWSFMFLGAPQLVVTLALTYVGADFVANSDDKGDLIMNTVGVLFINDLGDILYKAFTSEVMKEDMANAKGIEVQVSNKLRWSLWAISLFYPFAIALYCCLIVFILPIIEC